MEYGQKHRLLHQPNVIIGRGSDGDWVNNYDQPQLDLQEPHTALEGFGAISEYIESALERFEDSTDVQAGLVAVQLLHHYAAEFGELPEPLLWDMAMAVLHSSQPSEYLYLLALDAHPTIAGALQGIMQGRIRHYSSILAMTHDKHLMAYLEATNQVSPAALQTMLNE
ncbi:MAG: hypothetical protein ACM3KF_00510 [Acidobacteriota bacterium]